MSEFKGTKGEKGAVEYENKNYHKYDNKYCKEAFLEGYSQALKDSLATEMLAMLELISQEKLDYETLVDIKELIKKATE